MKLFLKVLGIAVLLAALFMLGFFLWGERFERLFSQRACAEWFAESRSYAWAVAIGLLVADLLLPIPATGVLAALGSVYGVALGALVGAVGSTLAGLAGYGLARLAGRRGARRLASEEELARFQSIFNRWGGYAVLVSRALPILPEVMAVLAGLARMRFSRFLAALLLGASATALVFAWLGYASREAPWWGLLTATVIPLAVWPVFVRLALRRR
ncbi:MAG TPA: VTT domain-containing protein [Phycisphaerae bacterium]|nr:VTT domain-containing protein [Phycisphaerae bacterium]